MHSKAIKAGLFIAIVVFGCAGAGAQETQQMTPEKRALIKELLELTGGTKGVNQLLDVMIKEQERDLPKLLAQLGPKGTTLTPKERAAMEEKVKEATQRAMVRLRETFQKINYAQAVEDLTASIFDKYFNEGELKEWIAFYKSPLGRKTIELMPTIYSESMSKISDAVLPSLQTEMSKVIAEETERLEKELKEVSTPSPATKKRG